MTPLVHRRSWFTAALRGMMALACLGLTACSALKSNTAMELIEHQQEQQAMMRTAEAKAARRNTPTPSQMMLNVVRQAMDQQRYFAVLAYARKYIAEHGHTPELDALYAKALMETGQPDQSRALYESLTRTAFAAEAHHGLGLLAARAHDDARAVDELAQAVALEPANPTFLSDLGYARLRIGDLKQARLALGQAAELAPNDTRILSNMAILLLLQNQPGQADALMQKADLSPRTQDRVYAMAAELRHRPAESGGTPDMAAPPASTVASPLATRSATPHVTAVPNNADTSGHTTWPVAQLDHQRLIP